MTDSSVSELTEWQFRALNPPASHRTLAKFHPAVVPGTVQQDLLRLGQLSDPLFCENRKNGEWLAGLRWEYRCELPKVSEEEPCSVTFHGLDTIATVCLDDEIIGKCDNMFRRYEFDLTGRLKSGKHQLRVVFECPLEFSREQKKNSYQQILDPGQCFSNFYYPFIRKAGYSAGWDWLGELTPAIGIWQKVLFRQNSPFHIHDIHYEIDLQEDFGQAAIAAGIHINSPENQTLVASLDVDGIELLPAQRVSVSAGENFIKLKPVHIVRPRLWWPAGHGIASRYRMTLKLYRREHDPAMLTDERHIGIRQVRLLQPEDEEGRAFMLEINGRKIFCKGANWIPNDPYIPRSPDEKTAKLVSAAIEANFNLLRVWGGGIYESESFYDLCDREGIMVMQDFPFACNLYPEDPEFIENIRHEAYEQISRLRQHPSLVLLSGNNECYEARYAWANQAENLDSQTWGEKIYTETLPGICAELAPGIPYTPGSPFNPDKPEDPSAANAGDRHAWQIGIDGRPYREMELEKGRFISEFGILGMPMADSVREFIGKKNFEIDDPLLVSHENTIVRMSRLREIVNEIFPPTENPDIFCYQSMAAQAEMMRFAIEHFRRRKFKCAGTVFWQFNDCWPAPSWSAIDWFGRRKALFYAVRRAYAPVLLSITREKNRCYIWIINDTRKSFDGIIRLQLCDGKNCQPVTEFEFSSPPNSSSCSPPVKLPENGIDWSGNCLTAEFTGDSECFARNIYFAEDPVTLDFNTEKLRPKIKQCSEHEFSITIQAETIIHMLWGEISGEPDAEWSDNFISILPGQYAEINVKCKSICEIRKFRRALKLYHFKTLNP